MKKSLVLTLGLCCVLGFTSCISEDENPTLDYSYSVEDYQYLKEVRSDPDTLKGGCSICPPN